MTHLDLCTGLGNFTYAAQQAGLRTLGFFEVDDFCNQRLKNFWPSIPNYGDLRKPLPDGIGPFFVLSAGFPCQPFSNSGPMLQLEDDRYLWPAVLGACQKYRPTWFLGENVPGINGMVLAGILDDLANIGYQSQVFIIPAAAVGRYQRRYRVWIVAHADGQRCHPYQEKIKLVCKACSESESQGFEWGRGYRRLGISGNKIWIAPERCFDGMAYGVPDELERINALGNGIVPEIAYRFFTWMIQSSFHTPFLKL